MSAEAEIAALKQQIYQQTGELVSLRARLFLAPRREELASWQKFANYCRECAVNGNRNPQTYEEFAGPEDESK